MGRRWYHEGRYDTNQNHIPHQHEGLAGYPARREGGRGVTVLFNARLLDKGREGYQKVSNKIPNEAFFFLREKSRREPPHPSANSNVRLYLSTVVLSTFAEKDEHQETIAPTCPTLQHRYAKQRGHGWFFGSTVASDDCCTHR